MRKNCRLILFLMTIPLTLLVLISCGDKENNDNKKDPNIPSYLGMEIINNSNDELDSLIKEESDVVVNYDSKGNWPGHNPNYEDWPGRHNNNGSDYLPDEYDDNNDPVTSIEDNVDIDVIVNDEVEYFVDKNEEFILLVKLSNPKDFEIQSFTLNGTKYSSYMFESGSDMENLYLKVTAPNQMGYTEYTIDAIKYIDGTSIKDVDLSTGEKTIKAGVKCPYGPTALMTNVNIGTKSFTGSIYFTDSENISSNNKFYLTDGENIIYTKELQVGQNSISIENLLMNYNYQYGVFSRYDLFDGEGLKDRCILKDSFTTKNAYEFKDIVVGQENISFDYTINDDTATINYVAIFDKENDNSLVVSSENMNVKEFDNLLKCHDYILYVEYEYTIENENYINYIYEDFKTKILVKYVDDKNNILYEFESDGSSIDLPQHPEKDSNSDDYWYSFVEWTMIDKNYDSITFGPAYIRYPYGLEIDYNGRVSYNGTYSTLEIPSYFEGVKITELKISSNGAQNVNKIYFYGSLEEWCNLTNNSSVEESYQYDLYILDPNGDEIYCNKRYSLVEDLVIPSDVDIINQRAFASCKSIKSVTISNGVNQINGRAFYNCSSLRNVKLASSIKYIANYAFENCSSLVFNEYENGLYLGTQDNPYYALIKVKRMDVNYFNISDKAEVIASRAFEGCTALTNIAIKNSVINLGTKVFEDCISLEFNEYKNGLYLGTADNPYYIFIEPISKTMTSFEFADSTKVIKAYAFDSCSSLNSIIIPNGVISIGSYAFRRAGLKEITIPSSVISIGNYVFYECENLEKVTIETGLNSIGKSEFYHCYNLVIIDIPDTITNIGDSAFCCCECLTSIKLPIGLTKIGKNTFDSCCSLEKVNIPETVKVIGESAFYGCDLLKDVNIPDGVMAIEDNAFWSCTNLKDITIPNSVVDIGRYAFSNCRNLLTIKIPNSITTINSGLFSGCGSLKEVIIPNNIVSIGEYAFSGCGELTKVEISENVVAIGDCVFSSCKSLKSITIPRGVRFIGYISSYSSTKPMTVFFDGKVEEWMNITHSQSNDKYNLYVLDENGDVINNGKKYKLLTELTVSNNMADFAKCFNGCVSLTSIVIADGITSIADYAFAECDAINSFSIPNTVTSIGEAAFYGCDNLKDIIIPNSVKTLGVGAFNNCKSLTTITLSNNLTYINESTFNECRKLSSVIIPSTVEKIDKNAFYECENLKTVTILNGVTSIDDYAFCGCRSLESIIIPNSVTSIGSSAFCGCENLENATFSDGLVNIGASAFSGCALTGLDIPNTVTSMGNDVLGCCFSLTYVSIPKNIETLETCTFYECNLLDTVYFDGTIGQWNNIDKTDNDILNSANLYLLDENGTVEHNGKKYSLYK